VKSWSTSNKTLAAASCQHGVTTKTSL
jgi:hypothetical protein